MPAPMTPAAALAEAKRIAATGIFELSGHAILRMKTRGVKRYDIQLAIGSATLCLWQTEKQTWFISGGVDRDGDALSVAVTLVRGMMVVTVYGE